MNSVFERHRIFKITDRVVSWSVFLILLLTYWLTIPPTVSLWDCPEYVTAAVRLEPGHPPGNPFWMLVERMFTLFVPGKYAALAVNMSSGLFTALAGMLLAKSIFIGAVWVLKTRDGLRRRLHALYAAGAAVIGALAFGWCDSTWYSAVEAEVYAMSVFLTALCIWLMLKWARAGDISHGWRFLILLAYIFGLSLGVHQLNLLVIPALAIVWALRRGIHSPWRIALIFMVSLIAVGCILVGMMPGTIALAAELELFAANRLGLPYLYGVAVYVILLGLSLILALVVTQKSSNRGVLSLSVFPAIFLSGLFVFAGNFFVGIAISVLVAMIVVRASYFKPHRLNLMMWMLAMLLTGYSSYALIPIRGNIPAPPNAAMPGNPFSFAAYQSREQYGAAPLLYGNTPFSKPLLLEEWNDDSTPAYRRYFIEREERRIAPYMPGARLQDVTPSAALSPEDSDLNNMAFRKGHDAYLVKGYKLRQTLTPELDMWFPRLTSRDPLDIESYRAWAGMEDAEMENVRISEAVDSTGRPVAKMGPDGKRSEPTALRPTYLQNFRYMIGYQIGYMYFRYLMWNFCGRQNDIPSTGEVEHGNFITGFPVIDNAMLQAEDHLPPHAGTKNKGRNRYFMLPFLLGLWGIVWMLRSNWRGRIACGVITALFIMTGVAIVVYLNQTPGEPRERDYTFLGSYMAFSMWIGAGALGLSREIASLIERFRKNKGEFNLRRLLVAASVGFIPSAGVVAFMLQQNYDDHDRSGRRMASSYAANILTSLDPDAIIFVDGDNYTFPLWYAQEVEGIRRDVRVVNLSYLSNPVYAAMIQRGWETTRPLATVLRGEDIVYQAHLFDGANPQARDTVDALEMLRGLKENPGRKVNVAVIRLPLASGERLLIPVKALSRNGDTYTFDFRKLMMIDMIASNAAPDTEHPRPFYWQKNLSDQNFMGLHPSLTDRIYAYRLGKEEKAFTDSCLISIASRFVSPNDGPTEKVYLDLTPATLLGRLRADHTASARRLLRHGHKEEALRLALRTEKEFGRHPYSMLPMKMGDSVYLTDKEYASLFLELADSLSPSQLRAFQLSRDSLRAIGSGLRKEAEARKKAWDRYRRALSPAMRLNMSRNP
ncbi:MAG: DUF2723 domain-containing protein [Muribaculaceae bacterium]|nr:DUF2723 domain-containing protein [Muribaculaceae bacterium]